MKKRTIFDIVLIFILLIVLIFLGKKDYKVDATKDNKRFDKEYSMVSRDNVFKYVSEEETYDILKKGEGIIFMAFSENEWSNYYAKILNDVAKEMNIGTIYYYNFLADREKDSVIYEKIVDYLKEYLKKDDLGKINVSAPTLVVLKEGNVMAFDDETSRVTGTITPENYWKEEMINNKQEHFRNIFTVYMGGIINGGEE